MFEDSVHIQHLVVFAFVVRDQHVAVNPTSFGFTKFFLRVELISGPHIRRIISIQLIKLFLYCNLLECIHGITVNTVALVTACFI
jgi:hypothetical protein